MTQSRATQVSLVDRLIIIVFPVVFDVATINSAGIALRIADNGRPVFNLYF